MSKTGPIVLVEDDEDDITIFLDTLKDLKIKNYCHTFILPDKAFAFLKTTREQPFIIFCDVNLPGQNGIEFKRQIDNDKQLREKSIPFVFYSTYADKNAVKEAFTKMTVQGFFQKSNTYDDTKRVIKMIYDYWQDCFHPNK